MLRHPCAGLLSAWGLIGDNAVAVAKDRIYTTSDLEDGSYVPCLDLATGRQVWKARLGPRGGYNRYPSPRSTPTVDGGEIFVLGQVGGLVCVDAVSGAERWRTNAISSLGGRAAGRDSPA